jgi:hypothetical protein
MRAFSKVDFIAIMGASAAAVFFVWMADQFHEMDAGWLDAFSLCTAMFMLGIAFHIWQQAEPVE